MTRDFKVTGNTNKNSQNDQPESSKDNDALQGLRKNTLASFVEGGRRSATGRNDDSNMREVLKSIEGIRNEFLSKESEQFSVGIFEHSEIAAKSMYTYLTHNGEAFVHSIIIQTKAIAPTIEVMPSDKMKTPIDAIPADHYDDEFVDLLEQTVIANDDRVEKAYSVGAAICVLTGEEEEDKNILSAYYDQSVAAITASVFAHNGEATTAYNAESLSAGDVELVARAKIDRGSQVLTPYGTSVYSDVAVTTVARKIRSDRDGDNSLRKKSTPELAIAHANAFCDFSYVGPSDPENGRPDENTVSPGYITTMVIPYNSPLGVTEESSDDLLTQLLGILSIAAVSRDNRPFQIFHGRMGGDKASIGNLSLGHDLKLLRRDEDWKPAAMPITTDPKKTTNAMEPIPFLSNYVYDDEFILAVDFERCSALSWLQDTLAGAVSGSDELSIINQEINLFTDGAFEERGGMNIPFLDYAGEGLTLHAGVGSIDKDHPEADVRAITVLEVLEALNTDKEAFRAFNELWCEGTNSLVEMNDKRLFIDSLVPGFKVTGLIDRKFINLEWIEVAIEAITDCGLTLNIEGMNDIKVDNGTHVRFKRGGGRRKLKVDNYTTSSKFDNNRRSNRGNGRGRQRRNRGLRR